MKANTFFDSKRLVKLIAYDMRINGMANLLKLVAFILITYFFILMQMRQTPYNYTPEPGALITVSQVYQNTEIITQIFTNDQGYTSAFTLGLLILAFYIATSFAVMKAKINRNMFLQLPASTLEKYLYTFLIRVVAGFGLFLLVFWMDAQLARLTYEYIPMGNLTQYFKHGILIKPEPFNYDMIISGGREDKLILPFAIIAIATFLFACPLFFRRLQLLKTIFTFFAGLFLVICLCVVLTHLFYPLEIKGYNMSMKTIWITKTFNNQALAIFLLSCLSSPFFLLIGYFRLKESTL